MDSAGLGDAAYCEVYASEASEQVNSEADWGANYCIRGKDSSCTKDAGTKAWSLVEERHSEG